MTFDERYVTDVFVSKCQKKNNNNNMIAFVAFPKKCLKNQVYLLNVTHVTRVCVLYGWEFSVTMWCMWCQNKSGRYLIFFNKFRVYYTYVTFNPFNSMFFSTKTMAGKNADNGPFIKYVRFIGGRRASGERTLHTFSNFLHLCIRTQGED